MKYEMEKVETLVRSVLERNKSTREDDHLLYNEVLRKINPLLVNDNFEMSFINAKKLGLPVFGSVSRARRKLQSANEDLRGSLENQKAREERQMDMFEYALKK
jgi:hypothetical protein